MLAPSNLSGFPELLTTSFLCAKFVKKIFSTIQNQRWGFGRLSGRKAYKIRDVHLLDRPLALTHNAITA
jgi:hypothetical protein